MNTITCPRCNAENPANAMNCRHCRINLKFALEHPDEIERVRNLRTAPSDEHKSPFIENMSLSTSFLVYSLVLIVTIALAAILKREYLTTMGVLIWAGGAIAGLILLHKKNHKPFGCVLGLLEGALSGDELEWIIALIPLVLLLVLGPIIWIIALALKPREE